MDTNNHDTQNTEETFADMFEKSFKKQERLEPGQMVETAIVKISGDWVFLDLGGKGEGYLDRKEVVDEAEPYRKGRSDDPGLLCFIRKQ